LTRPPHHENVAYNRDQWDRYAARWRPARVAIEDPSLAPGADLAMLGDEWGNRRDVERVIHDFILPYVSQSSDAAEIGSGGGRIAAQVFPHVRTLTCFDISRKMLERCRTALGNDPRADFVLLAEPVFEERFQHSFDFVYSFDVFVHLDLHTMWKYVRALPGLLRPGGRAFLHTSNLSAPAGWANFAAQEKYAVETHYFVVPQIVDVLLEHAGLRVIARSTPDPSNFYYHRDDLVVVEPRG
jgi:SAM-dependent methyltransferase